jgi:hypothetical protein
MMRDAASHQNAVERALTENTQLQDELASCRNTLQDTQKEKTGLETMLQKLQHKILVFEENEARVGDGCERAAQITDAAERVISGTQTVCKFAYMCVYIYMPRTCLFPCYGDTVISFSPWCA